MFLMQAQATPIDRTSEEGMYHRNDTVYAALSHTSGFWDFDGPFFDTHACKDVMSPCEWM